MLLVSPASAQQDRQPPTAAEVDRAIDRGVTALLRMHKPALNWEQVPLSQVDPKVGHGIEGGQWGGQTALATYALLAAGTSPNEHKELEQAINFLGNTQLRGVYALGMQSQVWLNLPPRPEYQQAMRREYQLLLDAVQGDDEATRRQRNLPDKNVGFFDYLANETGRIDTSVSQYGVLGLWAAARYGAEVPPAFWNAMEQAWIRWQLPDGSWAYAGVIKEDKPGTLALATAGVASLFITQDYLRSGPGCNGNQINPAIDRGIAYIADALPYMLGHKTTKDELLARKANVGRQEYYTLYGIERVGVASGYKYLGDVDWYQDGARFLLDKQQPNGSWGNIQNTAFSLLFLVNGRQPAAVTKLAYADGTNLRASAWNQRSRDVANLVDYIERSDERKVNWQIFRFGAVESTQDAVRELHDSPIAYLSGGGQLALRDQDKEVIKQYLLTGGMLVINPDCTDRKFLKQVTDFGNELFADEGYSFRVLPENHPIYTAQKFNMAQSRRLPPLMGLSNGVRELIVVTQDDPGENWQTRNTSREEPFHIGTNLYMYALDSRDQRPRGDTPLVEANSAVKTTKSIRVGRVTHEGNWNPEPAGWDRLVAVMNNDYKAKVTVEPVDAASAQLADYDVLHLTGVDTLKLGGDASTALATYVKNGGTLLVDAAGGDAKFAGSAEQMLREALGKEAEELANPLELNHPLYKAMGQAIDQVDFRLFARRTLGGERRPRIRGISFENRLGVIASWEDLSSGLVGTNTSGIVGYAPEDATRLTAAALLYAAERK